MEIKAIHSEAKGRYGSPHVFTALRKRGRGGSLNTVANIMRENHIRAKQARKFRFTTDSNHAMPVAENQMDMRFDPSAPKKRDILLFSTAKKIRFPIIHVSFTQKTTPARPCKPPRSKIPSSNTQQPPAPGPQSKTPVP
jgi:transposase InsO family protein